LRDAASPWHDQSHVQSRSALALFAFVVGCGEKSANPPKGPPFEVAVVSRVERAQAPYADGAAVAQPSSGLAEPVRGAAPVGHLERRDRLEHLFEGLAGLDGSGAGEDVRVVQFGDSHTASDLGTSVFRRALQARFGDGGRGFVSLGKPWKTYVQDGVRGGMTEGFEPVRVTSHGGAFFGLDGCYGLLGVGIGASKAGERAWTDVAAHTTRLELDYWQEPSGGSFDVFIDGAKAGRVATRADQPQSGFWALDVADGAHQVELRTVGDGEVRVFGMTLDRTQAGVVVDALGINGAQIFTPLRWNEAHFAEQLRHRSPDLVVLAYGTNESLESKLSDAEYARTLVDLLGRIARATPAASCLILGPPDRATRLNGQDTWESAPRIAEIVQIQRRVAQAAGCAFYDELEAMGGPGGIVVWAAEPEPRASRDHVHLTRSGYAQLATSFADDLQRAYDAWRAERGLPP
jgi:lysophospholipase L1-like esterase